MRQLIAGNWKMNGLRSDAITLAQGVRAGAQGMGSDLLVCPPFTVLEAVARALEGSTVAVGGQDCHTAQQGAHTGDVSAAMLRDAGATWVILGHSERRQNHGETDELVREKVFRQLGGVRSISRLDEIFRNLAGNFLKECFEFPRTWWQACVGGWEDEIRHMPGLLPGPCRVRCLVG